MNKIKTPGNTFNKNIIVQLLVLILLPFIIYFSSLHNQLTSWDDNTYISINPNIRTLHNDSIKYTLTKTFHSYEMGNYHPLTMLSYAMEYSISKLNPRLYHITNLILHLLNTLLVFCFIWLLTRQQWTSFITAILFAIHPMHVESVSWISARKDVLYVLFYLASLCFYILFLQKNRNKKLFYAATFTVFIFSLLSKGMAVSLPIVLFAIDFFLKRKFTLKTILEKTPFIILSIIFGYIAIEAQQSVNAITVTVHNDITERLLFSFYGIMMYLWKLIVPNNLSCFYAYPVKQNNFYPLAVYISPLIIITLSFLIYKSLQTGKQIAFGFLFFLITIALVLQLLPVGDALIADRYTYLSYIGLFFISAHFINNLIETKSIKIQHLKIPLIITFILIATFYSYLSFQRTKVWHDDMSLWTDAIEHNNGSPKSFTGRGNVYYNTKQYDKAIADFSNALLLKPDYAQAYFNRGNAYYFNGNMPAAFKDFTAAIQFDHSIFNAYFKRGMIYYSTNNYIEAIQNFDTVIQLKPDYADAYFNRGIIFNNTDKAIEAIKDFDSTIKLDSSYTQAYFNRGLAYNKQGKSNEAVLDFATAIRLKSDYSEALLARGAIYLSSQQFNNSIKDFDAAILINPSYSQAYFNRGLAYYNIKKYNESINDYTLAIQFNNQFANAYYNRAITYSAIKNYPSALQDILKARQLGYSIDTRFMNDIARLVKN